MSDQNATPYLRTVTDHVCNPANDRITITVTDPPGAGGANHRYLIKGFDPRLNPGFFEDDPYHTFGQTILFQNGPIPQAGVNGFTQEVLLAIVIDRLRCFQTGPYACVENDTALNLCETALEALKHRTRKRMERGVEGTHAV